MDGIAELLQSCHHIVLCFDRQNPVAKRLVLEHSLHRSVDKAEKEDHTGAKEKSVGESQEQQ